MEKSIRLLIWRRPHSLDVGVQRQIRDNSPNPFLPGGLVGSSCLERARYRIRFMVETYFLRMEKAIRATMANLTTAEEMRVAAILS